MAHTGARTQAPAECVQVTDVSPGKTQDEHAGARGDAASTAHQARRFSEAREQLFGALSGCVRTRLADLSAHDVASLAWSMANAGHLDAALFHDLARAAGPLVAELSAEELDNTEWAFNKAGQHGS